MVLKQNPILIKKCEIEFQFRAPTVAYSCQQHHNNLTRTSSLNSNSDLPFQQKTWFILLLLVMALCFYTLAILLLLTLDSDFNSTPVSATSESVQVIDHSLFDSSYRLIGYLIGMWILEV